MRLPRQHGEAIGMPLAAGSNPGRAA